MQTDRFQTSDFKKYKKYIFCIATFLKKNTLYRHKEKIIKGDKIMARVLISMPEEFLTRIDGVANNENRTRSELIREALRTYINKQRVRENALAKKNAEILEALLD